MEEAIARAFGSDPSIRILHIQAFAAGDALCANHFLANDATPRINNGVTVVKLFIRTNGPASALPSTTAGTDVGMEIWLPDIGNWNERIRVQIQGGLMGDKGITDKKSFSTPPCGTDMSNGQLAADKGFVVSSTDGGHVASTYEDMSYLMNVDGSINREGWKNVAWQATRFLGIKTKELAKALYSRPAKYSYLFGCSTGGRQGYHMAQKYPEDFDGILIGCPSITQSLLFPSLIHPHVVIHNDLKGQPFKPGQLEIVSRKAIAAGDTTITGQHDGYVTDWENSSYDPTQDPSVLSISDGGTCTEPWALSLAQATAINKIWYGPTIDGTIPPPATDNGTAINRPAGQLWWGKIRGTRIDFDKFPRDIGGGMLAIANDDVSLASPLWKHPLGRSHNRWTDYTHAEFAQAMLKCQERDQDFENMDADDPNLRKAQSLNRKIMVYTGLADPGVAPQSAISYYERSAEMTGGLEETARFHRLFVIPGMGHCIRYRGCAGMANPPIPTLEEMFAALIEWTEEGKAPDYLLARSVDGMVERPICAYPRKPKYIGGDVNSASSFET